MSSWEVKLALLTNGSRIFYCLFLYSQATAVTKQSWQRVRFDGIIDIRTVIVNPTFPRSPERLQYVIIPHTLNIYTLLKRSLQMFLHKTQHERMKENSTCILSQLEKKWGSYVNELEASYIWRHDQFTPKITDPFKNTAPFTCNNSFFNGDDSDGV